MILFSEYSCLLLDIARGCVVFASPEIRVSSKFVLEAANDIMYHEEHDGFIQGNGKS